MLLLVLPYLSWSLVFVLGPFYCMRASVEFTPHVRGAAELPSQVRNPVAIKLKRTQQINELNQALRPAQKSTLKLQAEKKPLKLKLP